jgi:hypothetical protein
MNNDHRPTSEALLLIDHDAPGSAGRNLYLSYHPTNVNPD